MLLQGSLQPAAEFPALRRAEAPVNRREGQRRLRTDTADPLPQPLPQPRHLLASLLPGFAIFGAQAEEGAAAAQVELVAGEDRTGPRLLELVGRDALEL